MGRFLSGFAEGQAKHKSDSALLREARSSYMTSNDANISDAYRNAARKELLNRGFNPKTGKFEK